MRYRHNIPRSLLFWGLVHFYLWMPVWVLFLQGRSMSLPQIGWLDAIGWGLTALAEVPTGAVADVYGRKASLFLGALLFGAAMLAVTTRVLSPIFVLGYLLWGSSTTSFTGADMALVYDSLKADGRANDRHVPDTTSPRKRWTKGCTIHRHVWCGVVVGVTVCMPAPSQGACSWWCWWAKDIGWQARSPPGT